MKANLFARFTANTYTNMDDLYGYVSALSELVKQLWFVLTINRVEMFEKALVTRA